MASWNKANAAVDTIRGLLNCPEENSTYLAKFEHWLSVSYGTGYVQECVFEIFKTSSSSSELKPTYFQILEWLKSFCFLHLKHCTSQSQCYPFSEMADTCISFHRQFFDDKLPFLGECCQRGILHMSVFQGFILAKKGQIYDVAYFATLYRVLQVLHQFSLTPADPQQADFWQKRCEHLKKAANEKPSILPPEMVVEANKILSTLAQKGVLYRGQTVQVRFVPVYVLPVNSASNTIQKPASNQSPTADANGNTKTLEWAYERIPILMDHLKRQPDKASRISVTLISVLCGMANEAAFQAALAYVFDTVFVLQMDPKLVKDLLGSLKTIENPLSQRFSFSVSARNWAESAVKHTPVRLAAPKICDRLWFFTELGHLGILRLPPIFRQMADRALSVNISVPALLYLHRVLTNFDALIDCDDIKVAELDQNEIRYWESCVLKLKQGCSATIPTRSQEPILQFLKELKKKGGFSRTLHATASNHTSIDLTTDCAPASRQKEVAPASVMVDDFEAVVQPCPALPPVLPPAGETRQPAAVVIDDNIDTNSAANESESDFEQGDGDPISFVRQRFESQPPNLFTKALVELVDKILGQAVDDQKLKYAVKTCVALRNVKNEAGKTFLAELQDYCLKTVTSQVIVGENVLLTLEEEANFCTSPTQRNEIVASFEQKEIQLKRKFAGCPRLVGKMFAGGYLSFAFVVSFIDAAVFSKSDDVYEGLLDMLTEIGRELDAKTASAPGMDQWWLQVSTVMIQIGQDTMSSDKLRAIVKEILSSKENGWPSVVDEQQRSANKLRLMLLELSPNLASSPLKLASATNRIRAQLAACSHHEQCAGYFQVFLTRLFELSNLPSSVIAPPRSLVDSETPVIQNEDEINNANCSSPICCCKCEPEEQVSTDDDIRSSSLSNNSETLSSSNNRKRSAESDPTSDNMPSSSKH